MDAASHLRPSSHLRALLRAPASLFARFFVALGAAKYRSSMPELEAPRREAR